MMLMTTMTINMIFITLAFFRVVFKSIHTYTTCLIDKNIQPAKLLVRFVLCCFFSFITRRERKAVVMSMKIGCEDKMHENHEKCNTYHHTTALHLQHGLLIL